MNPKERAQEILNHYFRRAIAGFGGDGYQEIRNAVDYIVDAAVEEMEAKLAAATEAPTVAGEVLEMRPPVVEIGGQTVTLDHVSSTRWEQETADTDGAITRFLVIKLVGGGVVIFDDEADGSAFLAAYRAYAGLDDDGLPPDGEPIPDDYWIREAGHTMDLLRDVLGDIPADMTSPAIQAAREQVTPF